MSIETKPKKCKGTGRAKGSGCGEQVLRRKYGLCMSCYPTWLYKTPEGLELVEKHTLKATAPRREAKQALEDHKAEMKLSNLLINVRYVCHNYIKLRDKGQPCVSCGMPWNNTHQAGHWKKAELYSTLRYDERNIHNQCQGCNLMKDGNVQKYADRITLRISEEDKALVEQMAKDEKKNAHKWDREELNKIRAYYKQKIKDLKA